MKIVSFDEKEGLLIVIPHSFDDLWVLKKIIQKGDVVSGNTTRVFETKSGKKERKPVFIEIEVEDVDLSEYQNVLRISGKIKKGKPEEFVPLGKYHTLNIEKNEKFGIKKEKWLDFELKEIKDAVKRTGRARIKILLIDEKEAVIYSLTDYGIKTGAKVYSKASKRDISGLKEKTNKFFSEVMDLLPDDGYIILAGPGFAKDKFYGFLKEKKPEIAKRIRIKSCNTTEISGVNELLKKGAISEAVGEMKLEKEIKVMEEFLKSLGKEDGLAVYGKKEVLNALYGGALDKLMLLDEIIRKDEGVQQGLKTAEESGVETIIFDQETMPGKQLKKFGGIAGLKRY